MRNFGIMNVRTDLGGQASARTLTRDTQRDSIPSDPALPRSDFSQTVIDVAAIVFGALFVTITGLGIAFSLFVLWFVRV